MSEATDAIASAVTTEGKDLINGVVKDLLADAKDLGQQGVEFGKIVTTAFGKKIIGTITAAEYDEVTANVAMATKSALISKGYDKSVALIDFLMRSLDMLARIATVAATVVGKKVIG